MNSLVVLGIGGSGTKSVEALIHLMVAGILPNDVDISFLDQDTSNGNLVQTSRIISLYQTLQKGLRPALSKFRPTCLLFSSIINKGQEGRNACPIWQAVDPPFEKLGGLFQRNLLRPEARHMLDCLFDPVNEVDLELVHGFRGRPAIGQAVLAAGLHNKLPFWQYMEDKLREGHQMAVPQKYFLIGSVFGGTGAAGVPTVARWLSRKLNPADGSKGGTVGSALLLPYFKYPDEDPEGDVVKGRLLGSSTMLARTRLALEYYRMHLSGTESGTQRLGRFDSLYMVGWPELVDLRYQAPGGQSQTNPALMPELLAALGCAHFALDLPTSNRDGSRLCRAGFVGDSIEWEDLPDPTPEGAALLGLRPLACLVRFAFAYKYIYYEAIFGEDARDVYHKQVWYCNLFGGSPNNRRSTLDEKPGVLAQHIPSPEVGRALYSYCDYLLRWAASLALHGEHPSCSLFDVTTANFATLVVDRTDTGRPIGRRVQLYEEHQDNAPFMRGTERYRYLPFRYIESDADNIFNNLIKWNKESTFCSLQEVYRFLCTVRPESQGDTGFPAFIHALWFACARQKGDYP
jgi:hypothetical protein